METLGWIVAGILFLILLGKKEKKETPSSSEKPIPDQSRSQASSSEADRVHKAVKDRIASAESKGTRKLAEQMYHDTKHFSSWIKHTPRDYVPSYVLDAVQTKVDGKTPKEKETVLALTFANGVLEFRFRESGSRFENTDYGYLELRWNDKSVLTLGMAIDWNDGDEYVGPEWHSFKIEAYIPGDWEDVLNELKSAIEMQKKDRELKKREDPEKLNELKKKFGL